MDLNYQTRASPKKSIGDWRSGKVKAQNMKVLRTQFDAREEL